MGFVDENLLINLCLALIIFGFCNIRKAAIVFSGDVGSVALAFIFAYIVISLITSTEIWQYVLIVSVYGIESVVTICERLWRKENIFKAKNQI